MWGLGSSGTLVLGYVIFGIVLLILGILIFVTGLTVLGSGAMLRRPLSSPGQSYVCPTCGKPLAWIANAGRCFCSHCDQYR